MRDSLHSEDVKHGLHGDSRVKLLQNELELFLFEEIVVEKVVDEVEKKLSLRPDLKSVLFGSLLLLCAESEGEEEVDEDDDGAERRTHFVSHVLVAISHCLQLGLVLLVSLLQFKVGHFLGDVPHDDCCDRFIEVLHLPRLDVDVKKRILLLPLQVLLIDGLE